MSLLNMGGQEIDLLNLKRMQQQMDQMNQQARQLGVNGIDTPQLGQQAPVPVQAPVQSPVQAPVQQQTPPQPKRNLFQRVGDALKDPIQNARIAEAFNQMRFAPSAGITANYNKMQELQVSQQKANQTVQQLRQSGRDDLADMIEASPENATAIYSAYLQQQFKPTFTQISGAQLNAKLAEQGLPPAYDSEKVYNYDEGSQKITQIGGGDTVFNMPDLTESQGASTNFYNRALNAENRLTPFESQGTQVGQALLGEIPLIGNILQSPEYQVYSALKANFISAVLRKESGAAISVAEFEKEDKKYFPQVGDKPETIEEKRRARNDAIQGLKFQAGAGVELVESQGKLPAGVTVKKKGSR